MLLGLRLLASSAALLLGSAAAPTEVRLTGDPALTGSCEGILRLQPLREGADCKPIEQPFRGPATFSIDLSTAGRWHATTAASRCWSALVAIEAQSSRVIEIPLRPAGKISGTLPDAVSAIDVSIGAAPAACRIAGRSFECIVPAGKIDLRIGAAEFVPRYLWDVAIVADKTLDVGCVDLQRGASVSGWVTARRGVSLKDVAVELSAPAARLSMHAKPNGRGFFQIAGVPPGDYRISARSPGLIAPPQSVDVAEARESVIAKPLRLDDTTKLEVLVDPSARPDGKPWRVKLHRRIPLSTMTSTVAEGPATLAGIWQHEIDPGAWVVDITDDDGVVFQKKFFDAEDLSGPLRIELRSIAVRGTVKTGSSPLAARLAFSSNGLSAQMTSDDDGVFSGVVPAEGKWRIDITPRGRESFIRRDVVIERRDGETAARIDVSLPGGRVKGIVTDEDGSPIRADVLIMRDGLHADAVAGSDAAGAFDIVGVPEGEATVLARSREDQSEATHVSVEETGEPSLKLVVRKLAKLRGWIVTRDGAPVAGALIRDAAPTLGRHETVSGPSGEFAIPVPRRLASVTVVVLGPGLPAKLVELANDGKPAEIVISGVRARMNIKSEPGARVLLSADGTGAISAYRLATPDERGFLRGLVDDGIVADVEPGRYTVCGSGCETHVLPPGGEETFDVRQNGKASP